MVAAELLELLRQQGVRLSVAGGQIGYDAPAGVMTEALLQALRCHKAELIERLSPPAYIQRCQACHGTNWGPTPNDPDTSWCLDCARPSLQKTPDSPEPHRASHRNAYACPACGPYTVVRDARGVICYRCHRRFRGRD